MGLTTGKKLTIPLKWAKLSKNCFFARELPHLSFIHGKVVENSVTFEKMFHYFNLYISLATPFSDVL